MNSLCLIRNTFGDRSPFLRLSLEYQNDIRKISNYNTWIFIDPKSDQQVDESYNSAFFNQYTKYVFENHKGRQSWYLATKYMFDNYDYEYLLSVEDDVILSYDYINLCSKIIEDRVLLKDNILYMHPGAWEEPKGDPNLIVYSGVSSRSILIHREKFRLVQQHIESNQKIIESDKTGNDSLLLQVCQKLQQRPIAPIYNRHAHFGIYGWSSLGVHSDSRGRISLFKNNETEEHIYELLKTSCFDGAKLLALNNNKNPKYFWNFDPNINFTQLVYRL